MKFRNSRKIVVLSVWFCIAAIVPTFAATQDVRVTNWPTSYSVVNTTWDSRLATLQTTLQSLTADMSQFPTFVSRFGWNGTMSFSQGFELLYNDVHSLATATSQSDILSAFNREFPNGWATTGNSSKAYLYYINRNLTDVLTNTSSIDTYNQHIDSDLHSLNSTMAAISSNVSNIKSNTANIYGATSNIYALVNRHLPSIAVDVGNISVDTEHISDTQDSLVSYAAGITSNTNAMRSDINFMEAYLDNLNQFFADPDTVDYKLGAKDSSDSALDNFTGDGTGAASASDYDALNVYSGAITQSFVSDVSPSQAIALIQDGSSVMGWFSVDTYNAFHEGESSSNNNSRLLRSEPTYPLLEQYYSDVYSVIGLD